MRKFMQLLSLALMPTVFSATHAAEMPLSADIRCLIIGLRLGDAPNADQRSAGNLLAWYYFGRLEKNSPKDIEDATVSELAHMTPTVFNSEASRCAEVLKEKSGLMQEIESNLTRSNKR